MNSATALELAQAAVPQSATPEHKRFQNLLAKIAKARQRLQDWQEQLPLFAQVHQEQVLPILQRLSASRQAWALELEQRLLAGKWTRGESQTLARMITELAAALLSEMADHEAPEAVALKALHDRHADLSFEDGEQQHLEAMRALVESATGVDLGDGAPQSLEAMLQQAREQIQHAQNAAQERAGADTARPRKGSKAKTAAQNRAEADAQKASQTVREVYRKLAAVLHPDRVAADASEELRSQRTEQMSRANAAYAAGDLLALLSLQLQIEQVDVASVAKVAAEQVRHFNRVLAEQLQEIEAEVFSREHAFCASYGIVAERRPDPNKLGVLLKEEVQQLLAAEVGLHMQQRALSADAAAVKRYLKQERAWQRDMDRMDGFPF